MLTHIVLFKLKDKDDLPKAKELLLALKDKISLIKEMEVGINIVHSDRSYDLGLYTKFDSLADMQAYQVHPEHVKFGEYITKIREAVVSIDYED